MSTKRPPLAPQRANGQGSTGARGTHLTEALEWAKRELEPYKDVPLTAEQERGLALWGKIGKS